MKCKASFFGSVCRLAIPVALQSMLQASFGIVDQIMIGQLGSVSVAGVGLASTVIFRGICAVIEAYLIYWPVVYILSRKVFKFTPEWAAPMASGISICGVAAAIATGSAIRARAIVPTILSSVIIVFVAVELLVLPWVASTFFADDPLVAGAWMMLTISSSRPPT